MDWGVPDWRDACAYCDQRTTREWGWEFLRRRKDYREAWLARAHCARVLEVPEVSTATADDVDVLRITYGLSRLIDPSAHLDDWILMQLLNQPYGYGQGYRTERITDVMEAHRKEAVIFDLIRPLEPQLKAAKRYLVAIGADNKGAPKPRRSNWSSSLRAIDAADAGATLAEIAEALWPGQTKTPGSARDTIAAARAVQLRAPFL